YLSFSPLACIHALAMFGQTVLWTLIASLATRPNLEAPSSIPCLETSNNFTALIDCFDAYTVPAQFYTTESHAAAQPSRDELAAWVQVVHAMLDSSISVSVSAPHTHPAIPAALAPSYHLATFTDGPTNRSYTVLSERYAVRGYYARGWGLFVVPTPTTAPRRRANAYLSAPHAGYDLYTPQQAGALFHLAQARSVLIAGRARQALHRVSACQPARGYWATDPAHDVAEPFFAASKAIFDWDRAQDVRATFVQMHGKARSSCPSDMAFISAGVGPSVFYDTPLAAPIHRLTAALISRFPAWRVSTPNTSPCSLLATDNVFGRLVNGVAEGDVCETVAAEGDVTGRFVHIEQAIGARMAGDGQAVWQGWAEAMLDAWGE
ncbi:unnamed protein product, partial [Mycena citricolor]